MCGSNYTRVIQTKSSMFMRWQAAEDKEHAETEIREYENAMDELERDLKDEMAKKDCKPPPPPPPFLSCRQEYA
jgi:hypothetical protein